MQQRRLLATLLALVVSTSTAWADAGLLMPLNAGEGPDPAVLSLDRMDVDIAVDERFARVRTIEVFGNHLGRDLEGEYVFFLPAGTGLSDFAIWEDGVRIPGVILERARARMHYENLTANKIDPGLLEKSEHAEESNTFSVKVFPIPAYGCKRIEMEYTQELPVSGDRSELVYPLKPARYRSLSAGVFSLRYRLSSGEELKGIRAGGGAVLAPPRHSKTGEAHVYEGAFTGKDVAFTADFALEMEYRGGETRTRFLTYRDPGRVRRDLSPMGAGRVYADTRGYFLYDAAFDLAAGPTRPAAGPLAVSVLFDCSLSMQWEKLDRAFEVTQGVLSKLGPQDRFALATFNDRVRAMPGGLRPAGAAATGQALEFLRSGSLSGGTDLAAALEAGLEPLAVAPKENRRILLLVSDGHATDTPVSVSGILERFRKANAACGARLMAFGVGSDANRTLLGKLSAGSEGQFTWAAETQEVASPLRTFLERMGEVALRNLTLAFEVPGNVELIYPEDGRLAYDRSSFRFVGRYKGPLASTGVTLSYDGPAGPAKLEAKVDLPEKADARPQLARLWARERVDWLLDRIALEGEKEEWIEEIVALAREHKFVTPYTSFLAAPRALLRPRVIKPGDPVLRVKTPADIAAVAAIFPFGLSKALQLDAAAGLWETRFLVPHAMPDGVYTATLVLTHQDGRKFLEEKSFVIDSRPPTLRLVLPREPPARGGSLLLTAYADADTRRITARLPGLAPVELRYDPKLHASTALVPLPQTLAPGAYPLRLTAEDFAHNVGFLEEKVVVR
ncbi:MAG: VWA domain-containing protein [Candidatus Wallbacteria bacterium]|nr:VWA domain-containing protein [Candidatus Wallbacteria bacterium]